MISNNRMLDSIPLWPDKTDDTSTEQNTLDENGWYHTVSAPSLVPFLPSADKAS